jgi:hypothetical protein
MEDHCYVRPTPIAVAGLFGILGKVEVPPLQTDASASNSADCQTMGKELSGEALASLCAEVAAETGIPEGRVRKVLQLAQRLHREGRMNSAPPAAADPGLESPSASGSAADRLRYYPLGANGRLRPPAPHAAAEASSGRRS